MFRKWMAFLLCFMLWTGVAQGAQLLDDGGARTDGLAAPSSAVSFTGSRAEAVLDDNPYTCWSRPANMDVAAMDLVLTVSQPALTAIWVRSGNQNSEWDYRAHARPGILHVAVSYLQNDVMYANTYRYALTDMYQPDVSSLTWRDGYQCLQLPVAVHNVQSISLTVEEYIPGNALDTLCISDILLSGGQPAAQQQTFQPVEAKLLMRMATRSGPSTSYEGLGSYFKEGHDVKVLSLCYDNGGTPWVQVEFTYQNRLRRAYTGLKRVDVDEALLPREECLGEATLTQDVTPRYGPGTSYAARNLTLRAGQFGFVYNQENEWAQFEYYDEEAAIYRRVWVMQNTLQYSY